MIDEKSLQTDLFAYIRSMQSPENSFVDEVSDVLSISTDSAYRRIRGDKFMVLPELIRLCEHFQVPLSELVEVSNHKLVSFKTSYIGTDGNSVSTFLDSVRREMVKVHSSEDGKFIFLINDLNLFQLLQVPELAAFKFYFWQKSGLDSEEMKDSPFDINAFRDKTSDIIQNILQAYLKVDTIELFTSDMLVSAQKQVLYYLDMGFIGKKEAIILLEKLVELADHICHQAELGKKFAFGYSPDPSNGEYHLYYNNLMTVDNIILGNYDGQVVSYLTNNLINIMKSSNRAFYDYNCKMVQNLIRRSELVSGTAERKRTQVFNKMKEDVRHRIESLR